VDPLPGLAIAAGACGVVLALLAVVSIVSYRSRQRSRLDFLRRLRAEHPNATREQFVEWFRRRGASPRAAALVYDYLQQRCAMNDFPLDPMDPMERVCDIVVHEEIDEILWAMGCREMDGSDWDALDWDALGIPPPSEPDAPVASLVFLVDALNENR
jgi:hypothetical protein